MIADESVISPDTATAGLENLSSTEILSGLLLFSERSKFPEQALYQMFREIAEENSELASRFNIGHSSGRLYSRPLRGILDHFEIGKTVEVPLPNPVDQFFTIRRSHSRSLEKDLTKRKVLPKYEPQFKKLATRFSEIVDRATQQEHNNLPS